ncbi:MAG: nickel-responsive transcriptional regulator NikR [Candidatus Altiarchaeia archaeon]|jgi:CopG family nickel-responsive transcriptional regulator
MKEEPVTRIAISLPPKLLEKFDKMSEHMGYTNRSEAIRDAVRNYILKNELSSEKGKRIGVISIVYDHDVRGVNDVLTDLQHRYHDVIQSSTHLHLDAHNCMELIMVKGEAKRINEIKNLLTTVSGVTHSDLLITGIAGEHDHTH